VYKNEDGSLLLFAFWLTAPNPLVNGAPATGIGGTLSAEYEQNNGGHLALSMTGLEEEGGGFYRVPVLRPITEVDRLDFYGMSSNSDIQVIPWMHNPILVERTAGSSAPSVTDGGQLVLATKAIITMAAVLERLKFRYRTLVNELADIHGKHPLNGPEVKTADGGTTLEVTKKIKQLEESIKATREAIKAHLELTAELEAGDVAPWTFETQLEL
jgi:hypothetical protein